MEETSTRARDLKLNQYNILVRRGYSLIRELAKSENNLRRLNCN